MEMQGRESLSKRFGRFFAALGAVFVITTAVVVTQRLSDDSLALLVGLSCGVAAMLPTLGLGYLIWQREVTRHQASQSAPATSPPVVVIAPQALPGYGVQQPALTQANPPPAWQWQPAPTERAFMIVGGEE